MPQFPHLQKKMVEVAGFRELLSVYRSELCLAVAECPYLGSSERRNNTHGHKDRKRQGPGFEPRSSNTRAVALNTV